MYDWCRTNDARTDAAAKASKETQATHRTTKAALGHAAAAQRRLGRDGKAPEPFKLNKFKGVQPRVCSFRGA